VLLAALCVAVYLPGLRALPTVDRDEARFAQASRQMLESATLRADQIDPALHDGGLVIPKVGDRLRLNKPPLIYWLQAGSAWVLTGGDPLNDAIWMYRVPSVLGATIAVLLTWIAGRRMFDPGTAWLGAAMLAVAPMVVWDAHQARADQVLLACSVLAMLGLHGIYRAGMAGEKPLWRDAALLWLGVALGVMTKGPVTPMIALLSALVISIVARRWRWLLGARPIPGLLFTAAVVGPWVAAVGQRVGWNEYLSLVAGETLGRSASAAEGHWGPPGYHVALIVVVFFPGAMLLGAGFLRALGRSVRLPSASGLLARWRTRAVRTGPELFLALWVLPAWIVFELVSTKLPHYTLPLYPALALLSARAIVAADIGRFPAASGRWVRMGFRLWTAIGVFILVGAGALAANSRWRMDPEMGVALFLGGVLAIAGFVGALRALRNRSYLRAQVRAIACGIGIAWVLCGAALPPQVTVTRDLARTIDRLDENAERPVAAVGYHEDSLVFATRGRLHRLGSDPNSASAWLVANPDGILILPKPERLRLPGAKVRGEVTGFNYSNGNRVELVVVERTE